MTETLTVEAIGGPNPVVGFRRKDLLDSLRSVVAELGPAFGTFAFACRHRNSGDMAKFADRGVSTTFTATEFYRTATATGRG